MVIIDKNILKLSFEMFKVGKELEILRKTSSKLISKTPTTLNKNKKG